MAIAWVSYDRMHPTKDSTYYANRARGLADEMRVKAKELGVDVADLASELTSEARTKARSMANEGLNKAQYAKGQAEVAAESFTERVAAAKDRAMEFVDDVKAKAHDAGAKATEVLGNAYEKGKEQARSAKNAIHDAI